MDNKFEVFMNEEALPYLEKYRESGYFKDSKGYDIHYNVYKLENANKAIVISHGFCECIEKYDEIIYIFLKAGYSVYMMEHIGHGYSHRLVKELDMVHIEDYRMYIDDFMQFVNEFVKPNEEHLNVFGHSMGGMIATYAIEENPNTFEKAVITSPMYKMQIKPMPETIAFFIASLACAFGKNRKFSLGQHGFTGMPEFEKSCYLSKERYMFFFKKRLENDRYIANGGSYCWVREAFKATRTILKRNKISQIQTPILLFSADMDKLVDIKAHKKFKKLVPQAEYVYVENSKHEIFNANKAVRDEYYKKIFEFLG